MKPYGACAVGHSLALPHQRHKTGWAAVEGARVATGSWRRRHKNEDCCSSGKRTLKEQSSQPVMVSGLQRSSQPARCGKWTFKGTVQPARYVKRTSKEQCASPLWKVDFKGTVQPARYVKRTSQEQSSQLVMERGLQKRVQPTLYGNWTSKEQSSQPVMVSRLQRNSPTSPLW